MRFNQGSGQNLNIGKVPGPYGIAVQKILGMNHHNCVCYGIYF